VLRKEVLLKLLQPRKLRPCNEVQPLVMVRSISEVSWVQLVRLRECKEGQREGRVVKQGSGNQWQSSRERCLRDGKSSLER